jgi:hypothetical protein
MNRVIHVGISVNTNLEVIVNMDFEGHLDAKVNKGLEVCLAHMGHLDVLANKVPKVKKVIKANKAIKGNQVNQDNAVHLDILVKEAIKAK